MHIVRVLDMRSSVVMFGERTVFLKKEVQTAGKK